MFFNLALLYGELAQLGARLTGSQKVTGSNPVFSTIFKTLQIQGIAGFLNSLRFRYFYRKIAKNNVILHIKCGKKCDLFLSCDDKMTGIMPVILRNHDTIL